MQSNVRMKGIFLAILVFGLAFLVVSNYTNTGNVAQIALSTTTTAPPSLPLTAPAPCSTTLPAVVTGNYTLCAGVYTLTGTITIAGNSTLNCETGTTLLFGGTTPYAFDGVNMSFTNAGINNCKLQGNFLHGVEISGNWGSMRVTRNTIDGAYVGVFEGENSNQNSYESNTIQNTINGYELYGSESVINGGTIQNNGTGILIGTPPDSYPIPWANSICSTGVGGVPIQCSVPTRGSKVKINSVILRQNKIGLENYGLDTSISNSHVESNAQGIIVQSIFTGSETNPWWGYLQEYFNSGIQISNNTIRNNAEFGISLRGNSTMYSYLSQQYWRSTLIENNVIDAAGNGTQVKGIIVGDYPTYVPSTKNSWIEYSVIRNNTIQNNTEGIFLRDGGAMTDLLNNTIQNNSNNGILLGELNPNDPSSPTAWANYRFLYENQIIGNGDDGVRILQGGASYTYLNQINQNGNRGYYLDHAYYNSTRDVICNDISSNGAQGFYFDGDNPGVNGLDPNSWLVYNVSKNRIINNGSHGIEINLFTGFIYPPSATAFGVQRVVNNQIANNGGKGVQLDGWFGTGFFANNILGNAQSPQQTDSGSNTWENEWDEKAYAKAYNQKHCGYNTACTFDWECGNPYRYNADSFCINNVCSCAAGLTGDPNTNTCLCYENAPAVLGPWSNEYLYFSYPGPYSPVGNDLSGAAPTVTILPSNAPPLFACTQDSQCPFKTCNSNNQQCGNYDTLSTAQPFTGFYRPGIQCPEANYVPIVPSFFPPPPPQFGTTIEEPFTGGGSFASEDWCEKIRYPKEKTENQQQCMAVYLDQMNIEKKQVEALKK